MNKLLKATLNSRVSIVTLFIGIIVSFIIGIIVGAKIFTKTPSEKTIIEKPTIVKGEVITQTDTKIQYVPKETINYKYINNQGKEVTESKLENTDLQANIGKKKFNINLNGQPVEFTKAENEKYVFDKNKVQLDQESTVTFNATVSPTIIDKTKNWGIGVGYSNEGTAYTIDFPVGGNNNIGGWVYKDNKNKSAGIKVKF